MKKRQLRKHDKSAQPTNDAYEDKVATFDSFSFKNPVMQFPVKQT